MTIPDNTNDFFVSFEMVLKTTKQKTHQAIE